MEENLDPHGVDQAPSNETTDVHGIEDPVDVGVAAPQPAEVVSAPKVGVPEEEAAPQTGEFVKPARVRPTLVIDGGEVHA